MIDCPDLRTRILAAISSVPCGRCRQRPDYKPTDCDKHNCRQMYEREADAVISVLPQAQGLSVKEQATPGPWVNSIPVISESLTDGMKETRQQAETAQKAGA